VAMTLTASANHTLDALLELVCVELQLTETQDAQSRGHYQAVADWLSRDGSPLQHFRPHIFPQGSQRLGTLPRIWCLPEYRRLRTMHQKSGRI